MSVKTQLSRAAGPAERRGEHLVAVMCPDPERPCCARLYPAPEVRLPPLIFHIRVGGATPVRLSELIATLTRLPPAYAAELIDFGAVYGGAYAADAAPRSAAASAAKLADPIRITRFRSDEDVGPGAYVRVHANPKRYPLAERTDWSRCIAFEHEHFVVVDKPAGVPTHAVVDNLVECALEQTQRLLRSRGGATTTPVELWVTSRLDVATSGLLVLAKSSAAAAEYNRALGRNDVTKVYKVLCAPAPGAAPPQIGELHHWCRARRQRQSRRAANFVLRNVGGGGGGGGATPPPPDGWVDARLVVLSVEPAVFGSQQRQHFVCVVQLLTGRTHQIRLQMAAIGAPVVGDTRYEGFCGLVRDDAKDDCDGSGDDVDDGGADDQDVSFGSEPSELGLRAHELRFPWRGGVFHFRASDAGWQQLVHRLTATPTPTTAVPSND